MPTLYALMRHFRKQMLCVRLCGCVLASHQHTHNVIRNVTVVLIIRCYRCLIGAILLCAGGAVCVARLASANTSSLLPHSLSLFTAAISGAQVSLRRRRPARWVLHPLRVEPSVPPLGAALGWGESEAAALSGDPRVRERQQLTNSKLASEWNKCMEQLYVLWPQV